MAKSTSLSEDASTSFADLASELAARCAAAIESGQLDGVPDDSLGQIMASVVRVYAAKIQEGSDVRPLGRNSGVTVTDVAIASTALLDSVALSVFELGAWQTFSGIGRPKQP